MQTPTDLHNHQLTLGTALFSDGFYGYALHGSATTNPGIVPMVEGTAELLAFDWRILEALEASAIVEVIGIVTTLGYPTLTGVVSGDSGTARFPVRIPVEGGWKFGSGIFKGGGKLAIGNLRTDPDGAGPWWRDFEDGFALLNPLSEARTFNVEELAGALRRTGIRRIQGVQAPEIHSGEVLSPITDGAP